jgi:NAD-dependent deacetylase
MSMMEISDTWGKDVNNCLTESLGNGIAWRTTARHIVIQYADAKPARQRRRRRKEEARMLRISRNDRLFVLTGAGVSAESGIPTFRGAGGVWRNYRIEEVASPQAWGRDPRLVWEFYSMRRQVASAAKPNPGHIALARLEQALGERFFLCTQNVDNLHEQAGARRVLHMHGELFKSRCDTCARHPFEDTKTYERGEIPRCECGGRVRPHICWFGEMPFEMERIFGELEKCTIFLAIGTSGVVEPAASFAAHAGRRARTLYLGPEHPANHAAFTEVHLGSAGELLPAFFAMDE